MIINHGYLGEIRKKNLNDFKEMRNYGIYEIVDSETISSIYNCPDDSEVIIKYFEKKYQNDANLITADILDTNIGSYPNNTPITDTEEYRFFCVYEHYKNIRKNCTAILEVIYSERFVHQRFTRLPDGTNFTRTYNMSTREWSVWKVIWFQYYNEIYRIAEEPALFKKSEIENIVSNNLGSFDDSFLRNKLKTKLKRSKFDDLVFKDRPDHINSTTTFNTLETGIVNFVPMPNRAEYGILFDKKTDGIHQGSHWLIRYNHHSADGGDTTFGNFNLPEVRLRIICKSHIKRPFLYINTHSPKRDGKEYQILTQKELDFRTFEGHGRVNLPQTVYTTGMEGHLHISNLSMPFTGGTFATWGSNTPGYPRIKVLTLYHNETDRHVINHLENIFKTGRSPNSFETPWTVYFSDCAIWNNYGGYMWVSLRDSEVY